MNNAHFCVLLWQLCPNTGNIGNIPANVQLLVSDQSAALQFQSCNIDRGRTLGLVVVFRALAFGFGLVTTKANKQIRYKSLQNELQKDQTTRTRLMEAPVLELRLLPVRGTFLDLLLSPLLLALRFDPALLPLLTSSSA